MVEGVRVGAQPPRRESLELGKASGEEERSSLLSGLQYGPEKKASLLAGKNKTPNKSHECP